MRRNIIEVENLHKAYGNLQAVKGISFKVKEGELFAFLGLNGAGKSTAINIISGILSKDSGRVIIDGLDIDKHQMEVRSEIGIVFQNSVLDRKLSVYDNLKIKAALYGVKGEEFKNRLYELSSLLAMKDILKRPVEKLSGGQRRKADIARALLHNPKILILDEPTTGLDPQTRLMVWGCINSLRKNTGLTVFLTTHYMEEAAEAENVVILDDGQIVAEDSPNGLKNRYAHDFIRLYSKGKEIDKVIKAEGLDAEEKDEYLEIEVENTEKARKLILDYPEVFLDFEVIKGRMDDVFLKVTGKVLKGENGNE